MELALGILGMNTVIYITSMSFIYDRHERIKKQYRDKQENQIKIKS